MNRQAPVSRRHTLGAVVFVALLGAATPARPQDAPRPPDDAPIQVGAFVVSPAIQLANIGYDDNVFSTTKLDGPKGDFTTTVRPSARLWLTSGPARAYARTAVDFVYFKDLSQARSIDTNNEVRIDVPLGWVAPFATGVFSNTRHREDVEIDAPIRRVDRALVVGAVVPATGRLSVEVRAERSNVRYRGDTLYLDSDLSRLLDRASSGARMKVRYGLTSLTTLVLDVARQHDQFPLTPERDSRSSSIMPGVEFKPFALISGRFGVGVRRRAFDDPTSPVFRGVVASVDLEYTALERTRLRVQATRDLTYSYRADSHQYVVAGVAVSVTQALGDLWDVRASVGRAGLTYFSDTPGAGGITEMSESEVVYDYGLDLGYRTGRGRIGFVMNYRQRESAVSLHRDYDRLRVAASLTYGF